jgi:hypothetical protein
MPVFYKYDGWKFEYSRNKPFGPWPVKNDLEQKKKAGKKFYAMFERFSALPIDKQNELEIEL